METLKNEIELILLVVVTAGIAFALSGCSTVTYKSYYQNGMTKSEYKKEGFISWSDGNHKVINLPLANPSVVSGK